MGLYNLSIDIFTIVLERRSHVLAWAHHLSQFNEQSDFRRDAAARRCCTPQLSCPRIHLRAVRTGR